MKKFLSLSLLLSLGLATISPALNAQTVRQRIAGAMPSMPAWTKGPGFTAAKKRFQGQALTPQEQQAFNTLKKRVGIGALVAALTALGVAAYGLRQEGQQSQREQHQQQVAAIKELGRQQHPETKGKEIISLAKKYLASSRTVAPGGLTQEMMKLNKSIRTIFNGLSNSQKKEFEKQLGTEDAEIQKLLHKYLYSWVY